MTVIIFRFASHMSSDAKQSRREQSHERILDAAARAVRRKGFAAVGVADVMKEAGLTHGGFYAHFASREALLAEAVAHAGMQSRSRMRERIRSRVEAGESEFRALVGEYLSEAHMEALDTGCPVAALVSEMPRADSELRACSRQRVLALVELVRRALPATTGEGAALAVAGTLVGALQLARVLGVDGEGRAVLQASREALVAQYDGLGEPG
jgi:AcrR family transcriptional regulator